MCHLSCLSFVEKTTTDAKFCVILGGGEGRGSQSIIFLLLSFSSLLLLGLPLLLLILLLFFSSSSSSVFILFIFCSPQLQRFRHSTYVVTIQSYCSKSSNSHSQLAMLSDWTVRDRKLRHAECPEQLMAHNHHQPRERRSNR